MQRAEGLEKTNYGNVIISADYVPAEQNLETLGYFSARHKRRYPVEKQSSKVVVLSGTRRVEIIPSGKYGFPNAEDLDFYRAFLKICDEQVSFIREEQGGQVTFHPRLPSPIMFGTRELITKAGREKSARELTAVREWVERLNATVIHGELYDAKKQQFNAKMGLEPLFRKFVHVGQSLENGDVAAMNYVWLADWFLDNYFHYYVRRVDLKFHQRLSRPIAKALYPLLDNGWFAANGSAFSKRYVDLCVILDIEPYQQISRVQQQLDPSHAELIREQFVASYEYVRDEGGKWTGTIRWSPGPKWFYDQEQKRRRKEVEVIVIPGTNGHMNGGGNVSVTLQEISLPLHGSRPERNAAYSDWISKFYLELGYQRIPQQKINADVKLVTDLVEHQQYSLAELDIALVWLKKNQEKFRRKVYSLNVLPHILGYALEEHDKQLARDQKTRSAAKQGIHAEAMEHTMRIQALEGRLAALSESDQESLRERAISSLSALGIKKPLLDLESLIRSEMLNLMSQPA